MKEKLSSSLKDFVTGIAVVFKAFGIFVSNTAYWKSLALPVAISTLIYATIVFCSFYWLFPAAEALIPAPAADSGFLAFLYKIWQFIVGAGVVMLCGGIIAVSYSMLFFVLAGPFADRLAERIEFERYGIEPPRESLRSMAKLILVSIYDGLELNCKVILATSVIFIFAFFLPVVGYPLLFVVNGYFYGIAFMVFSAEHHRVRHKEFMAMVKQRRALCAGFGMLVFLSTYVPLLPIIVYQVGVIAGVILFNEKLLSLPVVRSDD